MAGRFNMIWGFLSHYKYLIVIVVGTLMVGVVDENSFRQRISYGLQINELKSEIERYNRQYEADAKRLRNLQHDPKGVEKIARERYLMKADDEDIYVLSTDMPAAKTLDEQNGTTE